MLERLHYRPIIASLKPENILVDYFGHVSLCRSHHALPLPRRRPEFHPPRSPRTRSPQSRTKNNEPPTRGDPRATNRPRQFHPSLGSRRGIAGLRHDAYAARQRRVLRFQGARPSYPLYYDVCTLGEAPRLKVEDFPPPLVWAVRLGNPELTRLLLLGGGPMRMLDIMVSRVAVGDNNSNSNMGMTGRRQCEVRGFCAGGSSSWLWTWDTRTLFACL